MSMRCALGLHHWSSRATARAGTTVHRCERCGLTRLTHGGRGRSRKRWWLAGALAVSAGLWFVSYNLVVHRRTRVLHTMSRAARKAEVAASRGRAAIHRIEGDRGTYVDGNDD